MHLWFNLERFKGKEEALKYFENEVKDNDKNVVFWSSLGQVYMNFLENYEEAEKVFKRLLNLVEMDYIYIIEE